jgi:hypothetical protein
MLIDHLSHLFSMQKQVAKVRSGLVVRGRVAAKGRALDKTSEESRSRAVQGFALSFSINS